MPNIKSAKKRMKTSAFRKSLNRSQKSELRTTIKNMELAIETDQEKAKELLPLTMKELDQAAAKGLIHKNAAARKKSRLMQRLNKSSIAVE